LLYCSVITENRKNKNKNNFIENEVVTDGQFITKYTFFLLPFRRTALLVYEVP